MKKKWLKIGAFLAALLIIAGLGWFANALVGNPLSKWLASRTAERHLEEVYGDTDFEIERVGFNFKNTDYYAHIVSPSSEDSSFSLQMDMWGNLLLDTYEGRVLSGDNTARRLDAAYRTLVKGVLESPDYPFESFIAYGDLQFGFSYEAGEEISPVGHIMPEELVIDKEYDIAELGRQAGHLVIYVEDTVVTVERAAEVLLELKKVFEQKNVPFYSVDLVLEYPRKEEGGNTKEGRVEADGFLYTDIYVEGLTERVHAANEEAMAYHAEQDAKTKELIEQQENE